MYTFNLINDVDLRDFLAKLKTNFTGLSSKTEFLKFGKKIYSVGTAGEIHLSENGILSCAKLIPDRGIV